MNCIIFFVPTNSYGHPHFETLDNLQKQGCLVFRTDEQGSIIATSDGKSLIWNCTPSETWQVGKQQENQHNNEDNVASDKGIDQEGGTFADVARFLFSCNQAIDLYDGSING